MTTNAERIIALLPRHEAKEISMADIARIIGVTNSVVITDVGRLIDAGVVFKVCPGRYRLTGKRWITGREKCAELRAGHDAALAVAAAQRTEQERLRAKIDEEIIRVQAERAEARRLKEEAAAERAERSRLVREAAHQRAEEEAERRRLAKLEKEAPFGFSYPASAAEKAMRFDHDRKLFRAIKRKFAA